MGYVRAYNDGFGELGAAVAQRWPESEIIKKKGKKVATLGLALSGLGASGLRFFCTTRTPAEHRY